MNHPMVQRPSTLLRSVLMGSLVVVGFIAVPSTAPAEVITFSGTVTYVGSHTGDSLFVAVLDTTGIEDVTILAIDGFEVGPPPISQPFSFNFDNTGVGAGLFVVSFLDVGGGGVENVGGEDVFGWYGEGSIPTEVSSTASQSGLDFALPRAEIHGTITFAPGQTEASVDVSVDPSCVLEGFRPRHYQSSAGAYAINGIYPGTYCVVGEGYGSVGPNLKICFGDPTCASPSLITLTANEMQNGVDLDFTQVVPVERSSWGSLKSRYP